MYGIIRSRGEVIVKALKKSSLKLLVGALASFLFSTLISHPKSPVHKKMPEVKAKRVVVSPNFKIHHRESVYHVHHWMYLSSIYFFILLIKRKLIKSHLFHGFFLGGIIQGLFYKDRFHVVKKKDLD